MERLSPPLLYKTSPEPESPVTLTLIVKRSVAQFTVIPDTVPAPTVPDPEDTLQVWAGPVGWEKLLLNMYFRKELK